MHVVRGASREEQKWAAEGHVVPLSDALTRPDRQREISYPTIRSFFVVFSLGILTHTQTNKGRVARSWKRSPAIVRTSSAKKTADAATSAMQVGLHPPRATVFSCGLRLCVSSHRFIHFGYMAALLASSGSYLKEECNKTNGTRCEPCERGLYTATKNHMSSCQHCRVCSKSENRAPELFIRHILRQWLDTNHLSILYMQLFF